MSREDGRWSKDEEDWCEILAGKEVDDASEENREVGEQLRAAILAQHEEALMSVSQKELKQGRERLLFRLHREGLLKKEPRKMSPYIGLALAASFALMLVTTPMLQQFLPGRQLPLSGPQLSKQFEAPQVLYVADPQAAAARCAGELQQLGLEVEIIDEELSVILVVQLADRPPGAEELLKKWELVPTEAEQIIVEFIRK
ncbi:hypothetical protein [Desulfogranum mediterraneum]|uniref:hypothetical protein n=1 Tax=Desulfogranum mediterraneum TaxID=160661 RepID=UPI0003F7B6A1|nr:hypothetical protein [Desulfogranum mediterraneum]